MELSDFQRRLLGLPASAMSAMMPGQNATPEQQDMADARMSSMGQMGALLLAAGQRQSPQSRALILSRLANVTDPNEFAANAAQRRLMGVRMQQAQEEMARQNELRTELSNPANLPAGVTTQMAKWLGPEGVRKLLENQAMMNTPDAILDRRVKEGQLRVQDANIAHLMRPETPEAPTIIDMKDGSKAILPRGSTTPIPLEGSGKEEKPNKEQSDAYGFATRMARDMPILQDQQKIDAGSSVWNRAVSNVPFGYGNQLAGKDYQQFTQAQRDFINAVLRRESGAAISPQEFENATLQYFPQPGEDPETVQQKLANQRTQLEAIMYGMLPNDRQRLQGELEAQKKKLPAGVRSIVEVK